MTIGDDYFAIAMDDFSTQEPLLRREARENNQLREDICLPYDGAQHQESGEALPGDDVDAAIVINFEEAEPLDLRPVSIRELTDFQDWTWLGYDPEDNAQVDKSSTWMTCNFPCGKIDFAKYLVRYIRTTLICLYCIIYIVFVSLYSECRGFSDHTKPANSSSDGQCTPMIKFLRSLKFPLISIVGVLTISLLTRSIMFLVALCTWRGPVRRSAMATLGPFFIRNKLMVMAVVVILVVLIYMVSSMVFQESFAFELEEVFAPAGLATIIITSLKIEEETEFEKVFKQKNEKDGYVYGLAHQYFRDTLSPFLKPNGKRQMLSREWATDNMADFLLVLLVESKYLLEEVFMNEEFSNDVTFLKESHGAYQMKVRLAEKDNRVAYANFPVLFNEQLLYIQEWFPSTGQTFAPIEEHKQDYINTLRGLLAKEQLPVDGNIGRVYFVHLPHIDLNLIPNRLREAVYRELGAPDSPAFQRNAKLASHPGAARNTTTSRRTSKGASGVQNRDSGLSFATASTSTTC